MPPRFSRLLSSKLLEIVSEDKSFFVHSGTLAAQSESLHRTIANGADKIDLSEWDGNTVGLFVEFLYTGDYVLGEEEDVEEGDDGGDGSGGWGSGSDGDIEGEDVGSRVRAGTPDTVQSLANLEQLRNDNTNELLIHAKVYTLAKHKGVQTLQEMAFRRLRTALEEATIVGADFLELLGYIYSHTAPGEPTRDLVSKLTVDNVDKLVDLEGMGTLLGETDGFVAELIRGVVQRILGAERDMEGWKNRAMASDEKIGLYEAEKVETVRRLETMEEWRNRAITSAEKIRRSEAENMETVRNFEVTIEQLGVRNAENLRELRSANEVEVNGLKDHVSRLEREIQKSEADKTENTQRLGAKIEQLEAEKTEDTQRLGARIEQLEAANAEKVMELAAANEEILQFNRRVREFEAAHMVQIQEIQSLKEEAQGLKASNETLIQGMDTELRQLKHKVQWFENACPVQARLWEGSAPNVPECRQT